MRGKILLLISVTLLSSACATSPNSRTLASANSSEKWPERVIDAHVHMGYSGKFSEAVGFEVTEKEFLKQLSEVNGKGAIGHTMPSDKKLKSYKHLGILPCIGVPKDPNYGKIRRALKSGYGCIKIYLGYEYQYASDEAYKEVYRIAEKFGVPVVFHTGDTLTADGLLKYADPLTIDEVAVEFRKVKFVLAHIGNPWIQSAAEVAYKNPNVYIDVSALLLGKIKQNYSKEYLDEYIVKPIRWAWGYLENPKKMMFATDWPFVRIKDYVEITKAAIPEEHWNRFFYENAAEVFGIFGTPSRPGKSGGEAEKKSPKAEIHDSIESSYEHGEDS